MQLNDVISLAQQAHHHGHTVVLVTGVFDILHQEHQRFLEKAKALGEVLLVGVEADARVTRLKGPTRPVNQATHRVAALEKLNLATAVFILPEQFDDLADYRLLLAQLRPEILAVSSHTGFQDVKAQLMAEVGGKLVVAHQHNPAISSTILLSQTTAAK